MGRSPILVPVLDTPAVRLRPFRPDDASWVYYVSRDPELRRRLSLPDPYEYAHARYFVDEVALAAARDGEGADFAVEDRPTEIGIGWIGFHRRGDDEFSCGFWLAQDVRRRGLMTAALPVACRWALAPDGLGAASLYREAQAGNHASRALAERVGFTVRAGTVAGHTGPRWSGHLRPAR